MKQNMKQKMKQKRGWGFIGLFIIALVVSMPFYVADVYAVSVLITKNQGEKEIEGFIDAEGDVWTVGALVSGAGEVGPKDVKIKVGENEAEFGSCSDWVLGTACEYKSAREDGVAEGRYDFSVIYSFLNALGEEDSRMASDKVIADGSGPRIIFKGKEVWQEGEKIGLDFKVEEQPEGEGVGLEKIEIINGENGKVLLVIEGFEEKDGEFDFVKEKDGFLEGGLEGEGRKSLKILAEDRLGHEKVEIKSFIGDFVRPEIDKESLELVDLGEFVGKKGSTTDIRVKVKEKGELRVWGYSEEADLGGKEATCRWEEGQEDWWVCEWEQIEVKPVGTVSVRVVAKDGYGNQAEEPLKKSLVLDEKAPVAEEFRTVRTFERISYAKEGENWVMLKVDESGAGIDKKGVRANLGVLGGGRFEEPEEWDEEDNIFYWHPAKSSFNTDSAKVELSFFQDKAGNEGVRESFEAIVDKKAPEVEKVEFYGISEGTRNNYFMSRDELLVRMEIKESTGLAVLVDLSEAVMDTENTYPEEELKKILPEYAEKLGEGWKVFYVEEEGGACEKKEGKWVCELEIESLKSGYASRLPIRIKVYDTAGNEAEKWPEKAKNAEGKKGEYTFELLAAEEEEEEPNYWEVNKIVPLGGEDDFVDMDTTELISTRIAMKVKLRTDYEAKAVKISLDGCEGEEGFEYGQREVLFDNLGGGATDKAEPILIIEFAPFNSKDYFQVKETKGKFKKAELGYKCRLNIYSQAGKKALRNAERQEVELKIPFAFTDLGSKDENLKKIIEEAKQGYYEYTEWIGTLSEILDWLDYIGRAATVLVTINGIVDLVSEEFVVNAVALEKSPLAPVGTALRGGCMVLEVGQKPAWEFIKYFQIPAGILSCRPGSVEGVIGGNWYDWWQRGILQSYNLITGRGTLGIPADSLYDNFYIAALGLCAPGIIYNLKKLREVHCRRIVCLQKEVPQGIATVEACDNLYDLLHCEFFAGPGFALIPGLSTLTIIGDALKGIFTSPLGLISVADVLVCSALCFGAQGPGWLTACKVTHFIDKALTMIDSIVGAATQRPTLTSSPYCDLVEEMEEEGGEGRGEAGEAVEEAE